jgi:hypothetical protein
MLPKRHNDGGDNDDLEYLWHGFGKQDHLLKKYIALKPFPNNPFMNYFINAFSVEN